VQWYLADYTPKCVKHDVKIDGGCQNVALFNGT
jgi:hypothetical protein